MPRRSRGGAGRGRVQAVTVSDMGRREGREGGREGRRGRGSEGKHKDVMEEETHHRPQPRGAVTGVIMGTTRP